MFGALKAGGSNQSIFGGDGSQVQEFGSQVTANAGFVNTQTSINS